MPAIRFGYLESEDEMKHACTMVAIAFLLLGLAGCVPSSTSTPTVLPTASRTPLPVMTPLPTASRTPSPTMTHMLATTTALPTVTIPLLTPTGPAPASVWRILFKGFPCPVPDCEISEDTKSYYYSINSDGTGLKEIPEFPPLPTPPKDSPGHFLQPPPQLSPDGSLWAYAAGDGIYVFDVKSGKARRIFQSNHRPGGAICWTPDGLIKFHRTGEENEWKNEFYVMDSNGEHLRLLFTVSGLSGVGGDCSPDGRELASGGIGLHVVDLITGTWRKILSDYRVIVIRTAPKVP